MTRQEDIKRKIRAILSKTEEGAGTTEEEAATALEFARDLMLRHQLSEEDLRGEPSSMTPEQMAKSAIYGTSIAYTAHVRMTQWEGWLSQAVAMLVGSVQVYIGGQKLRRTESNAVTYDRKGNPQKATELVFYGPGDDAREARELYLEWAATIASLARIRWGTPVRNEGRNYAEGFASALYAKMVSLQNQERKQIAQGSASSTGCTALMVLNANAVMAAKREEATNWLARERGIRLRSRGSSNGGSHHEGAFQEGQRSGQQADFSRSRKGLIE